MKRKLLSLLLLLALCLYFAFSVSANSLLIRDDAQLLSKSEANALHSQLQRISQQYNAEIRIVTISSANGGDIDNLLNDLYDDSGYGYGENHDGVLLLVCMNPREYRILSNGFAADAITSSYIDAIGDAIVSDLSDGNYADAFAAFAEQCQYYLDGHINGFPFDWTTNLLTALGIGLLIGIIVASVLKAQLKSVRMQAQANAYVKPGSLQITQAGDYFMYRNVVRTEKPQNQSSSGGRGGSSRNTGGGSF